MDKKIRVAVVFGGESGEHEISLMSAASLVEAIDKEKYDVSIYGINKDGGWKSGKEAAFMLRANLSDAVAKELLINRSMSEQEACAAEIGALSPQSGAGILETTQSSRIFQEASFKDIDVVFPILHGTKGEDGVIQGLFELMNIPYVGSGVLASALAMDKSMTKKVLASEGIDQADYITCYYHEFFKEPAQIMKKISRLQYPLFVKPANTGSSVGISKVNDESQLLSALETAFCCDRKVVVEQGIVGREIEVAVLGNEEPIAPIAGEIISKREFYDYHAKYTEGEASLEVPADLPVEIDLEIRALAIRIFKILDCSGLARVDFFLDKENTIIFNEINTLPGFTKFSMYTKMLESAGISYKEVIDRLIMCALERSER